MKRVTVWALSACISALAVAGEPVAAPELTAMQIVEKNVAARGGLEAWRKIQTMVWIGHIERTQASAPGLPFVLKLKRPNKTHFEIKAPNQTTMRMFDGSHGWKLRPARNGRPELQAYTAEELNLAQDGQVIDGPLMDYAAKGIAVELDGVDEVEGHEAYRLNVKLPSGVSHHVWIDAQTFLDIKYDRKSTNAFGSSGTVSVFYRDYRTIEGLQIPLTIESGTDTAKATDKMVIDRISLNPPLEDLIFAKPNSPRQRNRNPVSIEAAPPQAVRGTTSPMPSASSGYSRRDPAVSGSGLVR